MLEGKWKTITKGQDNNWFVTSHNSSDTEHGHTTHCLCSQSSHLILFTSHNRRDGERKETFKNKLLHFNFVTFLWPGKPWQKLHVFLRETGQKNTGAHENRCRHPFHQLISMLLTILGMLIHKNYRQPLVLKASPTFDGSSGCGDICGKCHHLIGPRLGWRRGAAECPSLRTRARRICPLFVI